MLVAFSIVCCNVSLDDISFLLYWLASYFWGTQSFYLQQLVYSIDISENNGDKMHFCSRMAGRSYIDWVRTEWIFYFFHYCVVYLIHKTSSYHMAGCACLLELLAEPLYILSQNLLLLKLRLIVEAAATLSRCLTMYILIVNQTDMV